MKLLVETLVRGLGLIQMKQLLEVQNISYMGHGRVIAEAVCRRFPTATARVWSHARSCDICGGRSGKVFFKYFDFPYQFSFHRLLQTLPRLKQLVADVPSGLFRPTPIKRKIIKK
jgi:hypothetical protein